MIRRLVNLMFCSLPLLGQSHPHLKLVRVDYEVREVSGMSEEYRDDHAAPTGVTNTWIVDVRGEVMKDDKGEVRRFDHPGEKAAVTKGFVDTRAVVEGLAGTSVRALILSSTTFEFEARVGPLDQWVKWEVTREGELKGAGRDPYKLTPEELASIEDVYVKWARYFLESVLWWQEGQGIAVAPKQRG